MGNILFGGTEYSKWGLHLSTAPRIVILLFICLWIAGCGDAKPTTDPVSTLSSTSIVTPPVSPTFTPTLVLTLSPSPVLTREKTPKLTQTPIGSDWVIVKHWPAANQVRVLFVDAVGDLWSGGPGGLVHWKTQTGEPTIYTLTPSDPSDNQVVSFAQTPDGAIWVGTFGHGLYRYDGENWQSFSTRNGLPGNFILDLTVSPDGDLWVNLQSDQHTGEGYGWFGKYDRTQWFSPIKKIKGLSFRSIHAAPNGELWTVWISQVGQSFLTEFSVYNPEDWSVITRFAPREPALGVRFAKDGTPWVVSHTYLWQFSEGKWQYFVPPWSELGRTNVTDFDIAPNGTVWLSTSFTFGYLPSFIGCGEKKYKSDDWGVYRLEDNVWTHYTEKDGLVDSMTCAIAVGDKGEVWVGSFNKGISRFDGHGWTSYIVP